MLNEKIKLDWVDALKAFAILGILLNHAVESYNIFPWFSVPSATWPSFAERIDNIFPKNNSFLINFIQFAGWLGDMGPGVFILLSGLTLTLSSLNKPFNTVEFYKKRAIRIYPLYISIHLFTLFVAIVFFKWGAKQLIFWSPLSILGLRFTNSLFWFLNPSWWFIWLIIQLYIAFPFLFNVLKRKGTGYFLIITLLITLLSRIAGITGFTLTANMETWMTGLFGGTRLFEFAFGMYIGILIKNGNEKLENILNDRIKLPLLSILIYISGFVASWTYIGSVISQILITIGLSGIFYSIYQFALEGLRNIEKPLLWIGKNSFSAFLIHQTFMKFYGATLTGNSKLIALGIIIIASFVFGYFIERITYFILPFIQKNYEKLISLLKRQIGIKISNALILSITLLSFAILSGFIENSKYFLLIYLMSFLFIAFYRFIVKPNLKSGIYRYLDLTLIILLIVLIFRGGWIPVFGLLLLTSYIILFIFKKLNHLSALIATISIMIFTIVILEFYLEKYKPIEINTWGELPALKIDDETVYALIPNKITHLRYNNYNYLIKTNSLGFTSPEIDLENKAVNEVRLMIVGDAFSMPEGLNYEFSYPAILEKKLQELFPGKTIHVINAGVTGYGPNEEYAQVKKYIKLINPDIVINQLFINEFLEININRDERLKDIGLLQNETKQKNIRERFSQSGRLQLIAQISFYVKNLMGTNKDFSYDKSLMFLYEKDSPFYKDSVIMKMDDYLYKMKKICEGNNTDLIVLGVPGQIEVSEPGFIAYYPQNINISDTSNYDINLPLNTFQNLCFKNNIVYLNSKYYLKNYQDKPVYYEDSWHWNKTGHRAITDYLIGTLTKDFKFSKYFIDKKN